MGLVHRIVVFTPVLTLSLIGIPLPAHAATGEEAPPLRSMAVRCPNCSMAELPALPSRYLPYGNRTTARSAAWCWMRMGDHWWNMRSSLRGSFR